MKTIGIDIGTTSLCAALYDCDRKEIEDSRSASNPFLPGSFRQDPDRIADSAIEMLGQLLEECGEVSGIGISSQMHGILYVDETGRAVSDFYTWKDTCGEERFRGKSCADYLSESTGYPMYCGYGTVTHFALGARREIPREGKYFVGIGDYLAMRLCRAAVPAADATMAASFGGYDLCRQAFDLDRLEKAGVLTSFYPRILKKNDRAQQRIAGRYRGIPVFWSVGDNQASFFGALGRSEDAVCVNVGTGSQVSLFDTRYISCTAGEVRPFVGEGCLYVQASLNGGKVYERLALFLEEICAALPQDCLCGKEVDGYDLAQRLAQQKEVTDLTVCPSLYGSRGRGKKFGVIENITEENFHPADLVRGYVAGMAAELCGMYGEFPAQLRSGRKRIIASGNGMRKNAPLRQEIEKQFGMPVHVSAFTEDAAAGAAQLAGEWSLLGGNL